jgi:hypothetical protein
MILKKKTGKQLAIISLVVVALVVLISSPVAGSNTSIELCSDAEDTGQTVANILLIMQGLGPVFGTLFFVGLTLAGSASINDQYQEQRRKVLLLGFSVPVAIVFLEAIANTVLVPDQDLSCFFP